MNKQVDILIVGAGPVGLSLAAELRRRGIAALIVDRHREAAQTSRACVIHARTLEVLEPLGVTPSCLDARRQGADISHPRSRSRARDDRLLGDRQRLPVHAHVSAGSHRTPAARRARTVRRAASSGRRADRASSRGDESVVATVHGSTGTRPRSQSRWLVGCDGMHSTVREQAAHSVRGRGLRAGLRARRRPHEAGPSAARRSACSIRRDGLVVVAPLPDDRFRIVATDDVAPEQPSRDYVQALLDARGPSVDPAQVRDVAWSSRFRIHHRVARTPRSGRVLLCGDAAHVHSPAGGQGMNTGIQDAMSLAPLLADVLRGGDDAALDRWAAERHRIATRRRRR